MRYEKLGFEIASLWVTMTKILGLNSNYEPNNNCSTEVVYLFENLYKTHTKPDFSFSPR
ncbi:MAG: hypothetical protein F6K54_33110 [Okeania sp. SIO3B5]|uniref:hypothetical protein n=1 Tax=Okeania sp. SIO3B5 TaxID=2607811 RepID=UPI001400D67B|nr:hypothetical protein [Okeania sp. SIO3B5]NEO57489.1 hypothetical protein [Okeania sp. SIO3B5]